MSTAFCFPHITSEQAQQLYSHFRTVRDVADLLGCTHGPAHNWLKRMGVRLNKRGGAYVNSIHRLQNIKDGDCALRARPCRRTACVEGRRNMAGVVLKCVSTEDGMCSYCERGEYSVATVAGIRGGSLAPAQAAGW